MANCVPKLVAMATSLSTCEAPSNTWFPGPTQVLNANGISIGSAVFAELTTVSLAHHSVPILYSGTPFPPLKIAPSYRGIGTPI